MKKSSYRQSGIALITAVMIVAVISASAVYLIDSGYTVMRKTQHRIDNEQFLRLASSIESFAVDTLYRDNFFDTFEGQSDRAAINFTNVFDDNNPLGYDPKNDSLFEPWSKPSTPQFIKADLKEHFIEQNVLYITDLNRFFNINNLHFANNAEANVRRAFRINVSLFKALLREISDTGLRVDIDELTNDIIDWLDHDDDSRNEILLTEDDQYRRADSKFRPANRPVTSIGELENVLGMTPELMIELSRFVVALPVYVANSAPYKQAFSPNTQGPQGQIGSSSPSLSKLNVNTIAPELMNSLLALHDNESALTLILQDQGKFQTSSTRNGAINFIETYLRTVVIPPGQQARSAEITSNLELVTDVFSQFFLIESYLQKRSGVSFNLESMVYKDPNSFNTYPVVVQRQYDWLPQYQLKNADDESS